MSYPDRLATIHPTTPTITVTVYGETYPAIPSEDGGGDDMISAPQWKAGVSRSEFFTSAKYGTVGSYKPEIFTGGYSTGDLKNDYIGVQVYTLTTVPFANSATYTVAGSPVTPINPFVFGEGIFYSTAGMVKAINSTEVTPQALFLAYKKDSTGDPAARDYLAGIKYGADLVPVTYWLFSCPAHDATTDRIGNFIYAVTSAESNYYILRSMDETLLKPIDNPNSYAFTICQESVASVEVNTSYKPGFSDPDLPTYLDAVADFGTLDSGTTTYVPVAVHGTDAGFVITFKKKISGTWYQKYILVDKTWTHFQWVEFVSGNATATSIINQSAGNPYTGISSIDGTKFVSAFTAGGKWYLLGGTRGTPLIATSGAPAGYAIIKVGSVLDADVGFFRDPNYSGSTLIEDTFFGYSDLLFPFGSEVPDTCAEIILAAEPLTIPVAANEPLGVILRSDQGIWRVTSGNEGTGTMTLHKYLDPVQIIHETADDPN